MVRLCKIIIRYQYKLTQIIDKVNSLTMFIITIVVIID